MNITEMIPRRKSQTHMTVHRPTGDIFSEMSRHIDRMMNEMMPISDFFRNPSESEMFVPSVNVTEDEKSYHVSCELPGVDQKDVELSISNDNLVIRGEKKQQTSEKGENFCRQECSYGTFERVIPLGGEVDQENVQASYSKGVLKITMPKLHPEQSKFRKIEIKGE